MTSGLDPQTRAQALALYLGGAGIEQVRSTLGLPDAEAVYQALRVELVDRRPDTPDPEHAVELERIDALWRGIYARAIGGDLEAQKLSIRLMAERREAQAAAKAAAARGRVQVYRPADGTDPVHGAWQIMAAGAPYAAAELVRLSQSAQAESVRVQAGALVLGAVGLARTQGVPAYQGGQDRDGEAVDPLDDPAAIVRNRLELLGRQATAAETVPQNGHGT